MDEVWQHAQPKRPDWHSEYEVLSIWVCQLFRRSIREGVDVDFQWATLDRQEERHAAQQQHSKT
jgi:hypothetical protein